MRSRADLQGLFADWLEHPAGAFLLDCEIDLAASTQQAEQAFWRGGCASVRPERSHSGADVLATGL